MQVHGLPASGVGHGGGTHAGGRAGNPEAMLSIAAGIVLSVGTVTGLSWDWWRHPEL